MTIFFRNHQITIKRPHSIGGIKYAYSATFTAYNADIQPEESPRINEGGRVGKTYIGYIDATIAIQEGDIVMTEDGKQYSVKAVSTWSGAGLLDHISLILEAQD